MSTQESPAQRVAVVDIGSNSIKVLVAERAADGSLQSVFQRVSETRLGTGLTETPPRILPLDFALGVEAVRELIEAAREHGPLLDACAVGTAALRDALNTPDFGIALQEACKLPLHVISGDEEARLIAQAVAADPVVREQHEAFTLFDLGGGSLEIVSCGASGPTAWTSLPLGVVRMTRTLLDQPDQPVSDDQQEEVSEYLRDALEPVEPRPQSPLVGTGGGLTATLEMVRLAGGEVSEDTPVLDRESLRELRKEVCARDLSGRQALPGMPAARADVFPMTLLTYEAVLDTAQANEVLHSRRNLRWGMAAERLAKVAQRSQNIVG